MTFFGPQSLHEAKKLSEMVLRLSFMSQFYIETEYNLDFCPHCGPCRGVNGSLYSTVSAFCQIFGHRAWYLLVKWR